MVKKTVTLNLSGISEAMDFIFETLDSYKQNKRYIYEAALIAEESMVKMMDNAAPDSKMEIKIKQKLGVQYITLTAPGERISLYDGDDAIFDADGMSREAEGAIRGILLRSFYGKSKYKNKNGYNTITIIAGIPELQLALSTLITFVTSILIAQILAGFLGTAGFSILNEYIFVPLQTLFINLLQLVTAPTVFVSIVCCVAQFADFSDPGRISLKVIAGYVVTTVIAVFIGVKTFNLIDPADTGVFHNLVGEITAAPSGDMSFVDTIISAIPPNIIDPFFTINALQLMSIAIICGIGVGAIGDYSPSIRNFFEQANLLFTKITSIIINVLPVAVFGSTCSVIMSVGANKMMQSLVHLLIILMIGFTIMVGVYIVMLFVLGRVNPLGVIIKSKQLMKEAFICGSGLSVAPQTMRFCRVKLGISPKVSSFSIPFGAIVNLDGNCIYLSIAGLYLARMCGIELFSSDILSMIFAICVLSIGAPITPGSALLCLFVLLTQMEVPIDIVSLILGVNLFIEMVLAMSNTFGDIVITFIAAKSENLVDMKIFMKK